MTELVRRPGVLPSPPFRSARLVVGPIIRLVVRRQLGVLLHARSGPPAPDRAGDGPDGRPDRTGDERSRGAGRKGSGSRSGRRRGFLGSVHLVRFGYPRIRAIGRSAGRSHSGLVVGAHERPPRSGPSASGAKSGPALDT